MTSFDTSAGQRWVGWGAVMGGSFWLIKGGTVLLSGVQPPYLFEGAPFFLGIGLWGLFLQLDIGERGWLARVGAVLALAAAVSALVQLWAELFAPELVPREDTVTIITPFVGLAGPGVLASAGLLGIVVWRSGALPRAWLPLSIPLVFLASMIVIILVEGLVGETAASDRLLEVPVVILGVAWMWLGAMLVRSRKQCGRLGAYDKGRRRSMKWDQKMKIAKPLAIIGLLSGATTLILMLAVGDTFGFPGSAEYVTYEIFNRVVAVLLALQTFSLIAFYIREREAMERSNKRMLTIALVAWVVMALGTAAEFWLYSDLPYPRTATDFNMRRIAFTLFFLGSVIAGLALFVLGFQLLKSGLPLSRFPGVVLILYLPLFIALLFVGPSTFSGPALASIAIAGLALKSKSKADIGKVGL